MSTRRSEDINGRESVSPTERLAIERERHERPADYLAWLAAAHGIGEEWRDMTVREFCERISGKEAK